MTRNLYLRRSVQIVASYWARAAIPYIGKLPLGWLFAIPLLLIVSLCLLSGHLLEQRRRDLVLALGHETQALVREPTGIEFVTVQWSDAVGHTRTGLAWTGKVFARQFREGSRFSGQSVLIKYVDDVALEPVIISEAAERQYANNWWITRYAFVALSMALVFTTFVFAIFRGERSA